MAKSDRVRVHLDATIAAPAQTRINAGFRSDDTTAQINEIIQACTETSTFRSSLAALAAKARDRIDARQRWLGRRNDVLAVQSTEWNAKWSVIDTIIRDPKTGVAASNVDVQCAIQFLDANGQYRPEEPNDLELSDQFATIILTDSTGVAACHPTALGLQSILGQTDGYFATAGGKGPARRAEATSLAQAALAGKAPALLGHAGRARREPSRRGDRGTSQTRPTDDDDGGHARFSFEWTYTAALGALAFESASA